MARPIEPTPPLSAEDWARLMADLARVCSPAEAERRIAQAKAMRAEMMGPKLVVADLEPFAAEEGEGLGRNPPSPQRSGTSGGTRMVWP